MRASCFKARVEFFLVLLIFGALALAGCASNPYPPSAGYAQPGYYGGPYYYYGSYGYPYYYGYGYWPGYGYPIYPGYWDYGSPVIIVNTPPSVPPSKPPPPGIKPPPILVPPLRGHVGIEKPCHPQRTRNGTQTVCP
ncbi:MAG: hypothetical protein ACRER7_00695 [Gammaproteobacteria bacterium]